MKLVMASSKAGHDKGNVYIVIGEDERDVLLVNGRNRTLDKPKRKRKKHIQLIVHFPKEINDMADEADKWTDDNVKTVIRRYLDCQRQM